MAGVTAAAIASRPNKYDRCACGGIKRTVAGRCRSCSVRAVTRSLEHRFWLKVERRGPDECWPWRANENGHGYGILFVKKVAGMPTWVYAHRLAYEIAHGSIPDGLTINHLCRIRSCVNPAHLEPVTGAENTRRGVARRLAMAKDGTWK